MSVQFVLNQYWTIYDELPKTDLGLMLLIALKIKVICTERFFVRK